MSSKRYRFGQCVFDPGDGSLRTDGRILTLRPKVADLLNALIEAAPEIVTKEDLMTRVWPGTHVVDSGLARNMSELRQALAAEPDAIETVPKRGYRFTLQVTVDRVAAPPVPVEECAAVAAVTLPGRARRVFVVAGAITALSSAAGVLLFTRGPSPDLQVPIEPAERDKAVRREFQLGYQSWGLWDDRSFHQALVHFRRAGTLDADQWFGYVGIAQSYIALLLYTGRQEHEWLDWARKAAERAVQVGPHVAMSHVAAGDVRLIADWDWQGAAECFEEALRCNAFNNVAYQRRGILRVLQGRFQEARADLRKARELQPAHSDAQVFAAWAEFCAREFDKALEQAEPLPENRGKRRQLLRIVAASHGLKRQFSQARRALEAADLDRIEALRMRAWLDASEGHADRARQGLANLRRACTQERIEYCDTAIIEAALGELDQAFASLDRGVALRHWGVLAASVDPRLDRLRVDPRWHAFHRRIRGKAGFRVDGPAQPLAFRQ